MPAAVSVASAGKVVAFIDIGTNSVHLLLVRINPNPSCFVPTDKKEVVRLREGDFEEQGLRSNAIQRTGQVCCKFSELARKHGATETKAARAAASFAAPG
jgi:exopolyphosphatase/guanosine-5'-triphosphate,3'-diphosphate pyrophosphatase